MTSPILVFVSLLLVQAQAQAQQSPPPSPSPVPAAKAEYQVGPGDVLEVTVFGNADLSRTATIQTNGSIGLPLLGDVPVAGLTLAETQRKLTTLLERDYLVRPQVEVKVREYQSQFVTVLGEVNSAGRKVLRGRTRLIDVLVEAGGFTPRASGQVLITRSDGTFEGGVKTMTMRFSGGSLTPVDQVNLEVPLRNGDVITASPKAYVTVEGEINRPGRYPLEGDFTVTEAVFAAGGLTRFGNSNLRVQRLNPKTGKADIFLKVDLKAIRKGDVPDLPLLANDVVTVSRRRF